MLLHEGDIFEGPIFIGNYKLLQSAGGKTRFLTVDKTRYRIYVEFWYVKKIRRNKIGTIGFVSADSTDVQRSGKAAIDFCQENDYYIVNNGNIKPEPKISKIFRTLLRK